MPAPAPYPPPSSQIPYPALYLYPLNDSFVPKHISLLHNQRVKIGRQTNAKTAPGERNGYFDSKVLSRQHAEVWEENSKIYIKDVKSSNGTFINGERLSLEGVESEPFELKSDDIVEFGIDIVGEDNKTIIHHKVAARVVCVFSEQDAQVAARAEQHQQQQYQPQPQPGSSSIANQPGPTAGAPGPSGFFNNQQRRPQLAQQGLTGTGGMGNMRPPGKSGLTFDHILGRLKVELQKSRETGAELSSIQGAMHEINDTLGGTLPSNPPPYPQNLPPVRPSQPQQSGSASGSPQPPSSASSSNIATSALTELQTKLQETQQSLASHVAKIQTLEGVLAEQESMKLEVRALREMMEARRYEIELEERQKAALSATATIGRHHREPRGGFDLEDDEVGHEGLSDDDDDDARSIGTVVPHELERVEEEDEEQLAQADEEAALDAQAVDGDHDQEEGDEERQRRRDELGRPRTPEPSSMGMHDEDVYEPNNRTRSATLLAAPRRSTSPLSSSQSPGSSPLKLKGKATTPEAIYDQVMQLSMQVSSVVALTSTLEAQHAAAQSTIVALENKIEALEALVRSSPSSPQPSSPPSQSTSLAAISTEAKTAQKESLTEIITEWKKSVDGQWGSMQEEWKEERERLSRAREEWETKNTLVDNGLSRIDSGIQRLDTGLASLDAKLSSIDSQTSNFTSDLGRLDSGLGKLDAGLEKLDAGLEKLNGVHSTVGVVQQQQQTSLKEQQLSQEKQQRDLQMFQREWQQGQTLHQQQIQAFQLQVQQQLGGLAGLAGLGSAIGANGDFGKKMSSGLVTPPSPRSLSADSNRGSRVRRRRSSQPIQSVAAASSLPDATSSSSSSSSLRGWSRTRSKSAGSHGSRRRRGRDSGDIDTDTDITLASEDSNTTKVGSLSASEIMAFASAVKEGGKNTDSTGSQGPNELKQRGNQNLNLTNVQTAAGVLILSIAAAAVVWRVRPE
ncbi:hypothetical protein BDN72DRAFT_615860 [Pluteus cervinus]|uniref:Uncharacterized protein n=1 Tax=Pluteus cervinus TaxID=181527 RepID=A0ACD3AUC1_9AGAR|nr:hypothetical protein BDN72DRAFT_615860 [Pluteus cervinus]